MRWLAAVALALAGCAPVPCSWSFEERMAIAEAEAEICERIPEYCGLVGLQDLRRVEGPYDTQARWVIWGFAYPDTKLGLIWVDEIGSYLLLKNVIVHELLHLSGCWEHGTHLEGVMGAGFTESTLGISVDDVAWCRSSESEYR